MFDAGPKKISRPYLIVLYTANPLSHARLGIITSKRHLRLAVERARVRRIIRESFRQAKAGLSGLDLIVMVRSGISSIDTKTLRNDIDNLWQVISC